MLRSFFGKDSVGATRSKQIKTLRIYNRDVDEITPDQEYQVRFEVDGVRYHISVFLPAGYPDERPLLKVTPAVQHPWVDGSQQVVAAPGIVNYTKHCDLGQLVQNIVHELERKLSGGQAAAPAHGFVPVYPASGPSVPQPELDFPELAQLSCDDLQELLEDDDRLEELVESLPHVSGLLSELHSSMERSEKIAEHSLSLEPRLAESQTAVSQRRQAVTSELQRFSAAERRYSELAERYSPSHLERLLQIGAAEAEEASDKTVDRLNTGQIDVDSFLREYMELRTLLHARRAKQERLHCQLRELEMSYPGTSSS